MQKDEILPDMLVDEAGSEVEVDKGGRLAELAYIVGSIGLIVATGADAIAVAGRHLGFRLLGSIELIQVAVVLIAATAMIVATIVGSHAAVHILTQRLKPAAAHLLHSMSAALSAVIFLLVAAGSVWVASDLWNGHEQTEILAIPLWPFRAIWIVSALLIALLFAISALRRRA